jgi:hypothetical protein
MNKKEVLELIGKETVFKFSFCHESSFYFETLVPVSNENEDLHIFGIEVYVDENSNNIFHDFNTLTDIIRENEIVEVKKYYRNELGKIIK